MGWTGIRFRGSEGERWNGNLIRRIRATFPVRGAGYMDDSRGVLPAQGHGFSGRKLQDEIAGDETGTSGRNKAVEVQG